MISKILYSLTVLALLASCQNDFDNAEGRITRSGQEKAIIGGAPAASNEFPFLVNIWIHSPSENYVAHLCGASLIHKKWVMTAAHCLLEDMSEKSQGLVKVKELRLFMGSNKISGEGGRSLSAKSIVIHPDFSWPHHDVALIELANVVTDITPVLLNEANLGEASSPQSATVMGWGLVDEQGKIDGEILQKISVPLVSRKVCGKDNFPIKKGWSVGPDILCTQTAQGRKGTCPGDSGGPLVQLINGHYTQIGIVSWGAACRGGLVNIPSSDIEGYADVSDALAWIRSTIESRPQN